MKRYLLLVIGAVFLFCGVASANVVNCGVKKAAEYISVPLTKPLDSSGYPGKPDSFHIKTYADNGSAAAYVARSTTYPFSDISIDTLKYVAGDTDYVFADQIQDIDGAGGNFQLTGVVTAWYKKLPTPTYFTVQVLSDSLNYYVKRVADTVFAILDTIQTGHMAVNVLQISGDAGAANSLEALLDGTGVANNVSLTAKSLKLENDTGNALNVLSTYSTGNAAYFGSSAGNAIGILGGGGANAGMTVTGAGNAITVTPGSGYAGIGGNMWNASSGADSTLVDFLRAADDGLGADSGVVSRIVKRITYGIATGSGSDSTTTLQRRVNAVAISDDSGAAVNFETMLDGTGGNELKLSKLTVYNTGAGAAATFYSTATDASGLHIESQGGDALSITGGKDAIQLTVASGYYGVAGTIERASGNDSSLVDFLRASGGSSSGDVQSIDGDTAAASALRRMFVAVPGSDSTPRANFRGLTVVRYADTTSDDADSAAVIIKSCDSADGVYVLGGLMGGAGMRVSSSPYESGVGGPGVLIDAYGTGMNGFDIRSNEGSAIYAEGGDNGTDLNWGPPAVWFRTQTASKSFATGLRIDGGAGGGPSVVLQNYAVDTAGGTAGYRPTRADSVNVNQTIRILHGKATTAGQVKSGAYDGIYVAADSGHAINLQYAGASKYGLNFAAASTALMPSIITEPVLAAGAITSSEFSTTAAAAVWSSATRTITGGTITTNSDKTGYSLTQAFPSNFANLSIGATGLVSLAAAQTFSNTGTWSGNLTGSVGSVTGAVGSVTAGVTASTVSDKTGYSLATSQTFSTTGAVGSVTSGVTVTTNNDKTGYRLSTLGVDDIWDEVQSGHTGTGTFGKYLDQQVSTLTSTGDWSTDEKGQIRYALGLTGATVATSGSGVLDLTPRNTWRFSLISDSSNYTASTSAGSFQIMNDTNLMATVNDIADGVWDEDSTGHYTSPNMAYVSAQTASLSASTFAAAVFDLDTTGHTAAGTFGRMAQRPVLATTQAFNNTGTWTGNLAGNVTGSVASVTGAVGSVTGAVGSVTGNVGGNVTGSVGSVVGNLGGNVVGSVASVTGAVGSVTGAVGSVTGNLGGNVVGSVASVTGAVGSVTGNVGGSVASVTGAVGSVTGNVGGNVTGSVGSVTGAVGSVTGNVGGNVTGSIGSLATQAKTDVTVATWDADSTTHMTAGTMGSAASQTAATALTNDGVALAVWLMGDSLADSTGSMAASASQTTATSLTEATIAAEVRTQILNLAPADTSDTGGGGSIFGQVVRNLDAKVSDAGTWSTVQRDSVLGALTPRSLGSKVWNYPSSLADDTTGTVGDSLMNAYWGVDVTTIGGSGGSGAASALRDILDGGGSAYGADLNYLSLSGTNSTSGTFRIANTNGPGIVFNNTGHDIEKTGAARADIYAVVDSVRGVGGSSGGGADSAAIVSGLLGALPADTGDGSILGQLVRNLDGTISGISSPSGNGAYTRYIVVVDTGTTPDSVVPLVTVTVNNIAQSASPYTDGTDNLGVATFNLDAGTWVRLVQWPGYVQRVDTFTVVGTRTDTLRVYRVNTGLTPISFQINAPGRGPGGTVVPSQYAVVNAVLYSENDSTLHNGDSLIITEADRFSADTANASGLATLYLYPNSIFTNDSSYYKVTIRDKRGAVIYGPKKIRVPVSVPALPFTSSSIVKW